MAPSPSRLLGLVSTLYVESAEVLEPVEGEFARLTDLSAILGVTKQRCHQLAQRDDFPPPAKLIGERRLWLRSDVELWAGETWVAISGGGALSSLETTVLLTVDETMDAMRKAEQIQYRAPGV